MRLGDAPKAKINPRPDEESKIRILSQYLTVCLDLLARLLPNPRFIPFYIA